MFFNLLINSISLRNATLKNAPLVSRDKAGLDSGKGPELKGGQASRTELTKCFKYTASKLLLLFI